MLEQRPQNSVPFENLSSFEIHFQSHDWTEKLNPKTSYLLPLIRLFDAVEKQIQHFDLMTVSNKSKLLSIGIWTLQVGLFVGLLLGFCRKVPLIVCDHNSLNLLKDSNPYSRPFPATLCPC